MYFLQVRIRPRLDPTSRLTTASSSPGPTSAPELSIAADDGGSTKPSLRSDKDAGPLSVNRAIHADTMTTLGFPPQPLSLVSDVDSGIATITGASQRAEHGRENAAVIGIENNGYLCAFESESNVGTPSHPNSPRPLRWRRYPAVTASLQRSAKAATSSTPTRYPAMRLANSAADLLGSQTRTVFPGGVCASSARRLGISRGAESGCACTTSSSKSGSKLKMLTVVIKSNMARRDPSLPACSYFSTLAREICNTCSLSFVLGRLEPVLGNLRGAECTGRCLFEMCRPGGLQLGLECHVRIEMCTFTTNTWHRQGQMPPEREPEQSSI
ncbi:hypothetical protein EDB92DRAFT_1818456 [Lactarius akahatsu]|uniref:Uncharacterized protein n=1 Tax=Lactarius akahatsu TaxID=416441 RepID=A0AAD4LA12_9AGAM|nr:hypothetical protein EDB92DRAFT_1818456 [Lactarius akahatsu]